MIFNLNDTWKEIYQSLPLKNKVVRMTPIVFLRSQTFHNIFVNNENKNLFISLSREDQSAKSCIQKNQKQYNRHVPNMKHFVSTHLFDYHAIIVNTWECWANEIFKLAIITPPPSFGWGNSGYWSDPFLLILNITRTTRVKNSISLIIHYTKAEYYL